MLRRALIGTGLVGLALSIWSLVWWPLVPPLFVIAGWCLLLLIGLVFERSRYKAIEIERPGAGFRPTDESFVDPETGEAVRVFYNARTGERRYVRHDLGSPP